MSRCARDLPVLGSATGWNVMAGAPPASGTRDSVAVPSSPSATAISPEEEIERMSQVPSPKGRDSGLSGRVEKSSSGLASQAAL